MDQTRRVSTVRAVSSFDWLLEQIKSLIFTTVLTILGKQIWARLSPRRRYVIFGAALETFACMLFSVPVLALQMIGFNQITLCILLIYLMPAMPLLLFVHMKLEPKIYKMAFGEDRACSRGRFAFPFQ
jgi:hypothetical protein